MTAVFQSSGRQNWRDLLDKKHVCCHGKFWCRSSVPNLVLTLVWTRYVASETRICYLAVLSEESTFVSSLHSKLLVCGIMYGELKIYRGNGTHIVCLLKMLRVNRRLLNISGKCNIRTDEQTCTFWRACSERTHGNLALCLPTGCTA